MPKMTMLARVSDGLMLSASQDTSDFQAHQAEAKSIFRKLHAGSPDRCSLEAGDFMFQYV